MTTWPVTSALIKFVGSSVVMLMIKTNSRGQKSPSTCKERVRHVSLQINDFYSSHVSVMNECNTNYFVAKTFMKFGSVINLSKVFRKCDQICWIKNLPVVNLIFGSVSLGHFHLS